MEFDLPRQRCVSNGLANGMSTPEIFQSDTKLTFVLGSGVRRIYLDGRKPPEYTEWFPLGISSGHWEGSTLVIRTSRISWPYYDDIGSPQSEEMEVIEHFALSDDGNRLDYVQTAFDPLTFLEPAVINGHFWLVPGDEIKPFNCDYASE